MRFTTLHLIERNYGIEVTIDRPEKNNTLNSLFLQEINDLLDYLENQPQHRILLLKGSKDFFCTGLDFQEISAFTTAPQLEQWGQLYANTLKRFITSSQFIVSFVEGKVIAGGLGLVAASDWVIASENASFKLTEALWGLTPAIIAPYLLRRISSHQLLSLTLTCKGINASEAEAIHLVDEVNNHTDNALDQLFSRIQRIDTATIKQIKQFFNRFQPISDTMEREAIAEFVCGISSDNTKQHIRNYLADGTLPWKKIF